jgi:hypothetical protein
MARAIISSNQRRTCHEPLYIASSGATIEVFYADRVLATSFGGRAGWHWWSCLPGCLPHMAPRGPFITNYGALRDALTCGSNALPFGKRIRTCLTAP